MHEVGNAEIPAVIWAIALVVVGYLFILHQAKAAAARKVQIRKLQRLAAEEVARAEQEEAEEFSSKITRTSGSVFQNRSSSSVIISHPTPVTTAALSTPHSSPVVKRASFTGSSRASTALGLCAVCSNPTKKQCSRCKRVKYCSQQCQVQHWREGHKHECHESEKRLFSTDAQSNAVLSNLGSSIAKDDDSNINNVFNSSVFFSSQQCQVQHWREGHKHECHESEKQLFSTDAQSNAVLSNLGSSIAKDDDSNINDISFEERLPEAPSKPSRTLETVTTDGSLPKPNKILFPYEHFIELFTWNKLKLVPCGLINCGNSCFASVVLQCLTYTRPLAAYLLEGRHSQECRRNKWCFMCELQHHVSRVRESQIPFSPIRIVSQIRNIGNHLGYGRQEDAHEFTRFAIDSMQSICLDNVGGEKAVDQRTQETTFIHHIFGGHLQSQVRCMQCHHESHKYENMMDLAVEIQGNVETLEDALAHFTLPEWLDGDNKYKCEWCNAYVKAWKRLAIHEAPNILTIALKRFQSGNFGKLNKLNKRVTFPDVLDMSPYMSEEGDKPPHYQLYGVIVHIDMLNSSFFGHYICYVKDLHGSWYKIDDSKVKEVDLDKVMQQRAYMLFYTRSGPRCAPIISKGGMQPVEGICVNSCNSKRTTMSNGNHILPELPSVFSNEAANGNGSNFYVSESNGVMLYSENSDVLTQ